MIRKMKTKLTSRDELIQRLAENLQALMEKKGINAKELANLTLEGVSEMDISRALRGTRLIGADKILRIAEATKTPVQKLFKI